MFVTDYTTFAEIRAALGVSDDELEDATLELTLYSDALQIDLEDVHINIPTTYAALVALTSPTEAERRFLQTAHLFATYSVAKQLAASLPMFSPEQITDGKAALRRAQGNPYQKVIEAVGSEYSRFRTRLDQLFSAINSTASAGVTKKSYFGVVSPSTDPITGA